MITEINNDQDYYKACKRLEELGDDSEFEFDFEMQAEWDKIYALTQEYENKTQVKVK